MIRVSSFTHKGNITLARLHLHEQDDAQPKIVDVKFRGTLSREEIVEAYAKNLQI